MEVGREGRGHFLVDVRWDITPHNATNDEIDDEDVPSQMVHGFSVRETCYFRLEDYVFEHIRGFDTEQDVIDYLMTGIAEKFTHY